MDIGNTKLVGKNISLLPLKREHIEQLAAIGAREELWEFTVDQILTAEDMGRYVEQAIADRNEGKAVPFITCTNDSYKIVGSTRFGNIDAANRKLEIGWTWIAPEFQRTSVNTEAKLLMLTHAFAVLRCVRVEFKTDALNVRSREAILRLGAKQEGILRQHMITDRGRFRDSVYFSILDNEWDSVKKNLLQRLERH